MASFTHYWKGSTCADMAESEGEPLNHAASNHFTKRGVTTGSRTYVGCISCWATTGTLQLPCFAM